jgi:uncharacterized protein with HEPN domain
MHLRFSFCALLLMLTACARHPNQEWLIVPGERVGPIIASTSEADLRKSFGAAAVLSKDIEIGEGVTEPGTVIYESSPDKALAVTWKDVSRMRPSEVIICYGEIQGNCLWRTADGIGIGTTLKDLERRNGGAFDLAGFGWDYAGRVTSWNGGKLSGMRLPMMLGPDSNALYALNEDEKMAVMGEQTVQSSHPLMQKLNPAVYSLQLLFP